MPTVSRIYFVYYHTFTSFVLECKFKKLYFYQYVLKL